MNEQIKQRITQLNKGEVPEGYEQTYFGIFPKDWETQKTLNDVADCYDGSHETPTYTNDGVPFVSVENIRDIYATDKYISEKDFNEKYKLRPQKDDILMTRIGDVGTPALVTKNIPIAYYVSLSLIRPKAINPKFLYSAIQGNVIQKSLFEKTLHIAFPQKINLQDIGKCRLVCPKSMDEQSKIAEILIKWDEAIELQEQHIQKITLKKKAYMDKFFCSRKEEKIKFKTLYTTAGEGGTPDTKKYEYYDSNDIPFVKIEHLLDKYITQIDSYISDLGLQKSGAWLIPENSLIFSNGATIGEASINKIPVATKQGILGIIPSSNIDIEYFYYLVKSKYFLSKVKKITTKGTMCTAYLKDIDKLKLYIHDTVKQKEISAFLSAIDDLIVAENEKLQHLKKQRKALQQYLLNGIVRV